MLKKCLFALGFALAGLLPAQAEVSIDNCIAEINPKEIVFQIGLHNMDDVPLFGPILVRLEAHAAPGQAWREVKTWDLEAMRAGKTWSEEYISEDEAAQATASKTYEDRLTVECTGITKREKLFRMIQVK